MKIPVRGSWSVAALGLLALSCGGTGTVARDVGVSPAVAASSPAEALVPEIERLIGSAACSRDDDCRVVGVGARACGGPEGYRAWSVRQTDAQRLTALVERQAALRRAELERLGMLSTCDFRPAPQAACRQAAGAAAGRCVTRDRTLAN